MAGATPDIQQILEQLRATQQRPATTTPSQGQPGLPAPSYPAQAGYAMPAQANAPPPGASYPPPAQYGYPQPSSSGTVDLSAIKPVTSGTVSLQDAIAKAKAVAAANNLAPYERAPVYGGADSHAGDNRDWQRSRSRSPRRDNYREPNPYRDERRDDRPARDYGHHARDRSYSPGPRGRQGGGAFSPRGSNSARQRSPLRGDDDNAAETMEIEASLVGLIIGRQGENLRRVEGETKCRVQFLPPNSSDDKFRQCKITGPRARRAEARNAINRIIEDSGMGAIARAGLDRGGPRPPPPVVDRGGVANLKEGEDCLQIMVPDRTVGLIIGRGGETIRDLQERSGCHVNIVGESKSVNGLRPVNLIGPYAAAAQAKEMIMEIVDSDSRANGAAGPPARGPRDNMHEKTQDAIFVPNEAVGMIIGKGGETIREMQNTTGCKINVSQQPQPGQSDREIELVGSRDAIERAKQAIEDKVEAVKQKSNGGGGGGGGGRGGGGGGRGHHRDYDNPSYGQSSNNQHAGNQGVPAAQAPAVADGQPDPYAAYGGYQNYLALWYQSYAQNAAGAAGQGDATKPPGTS
ncbi:hypothetical protein BD289DRAFT_458646 [Coniella lustricola]|uniref:K Homology domain-containing protein n=1 Tax=Coniella lustricola TaxID=2025994 RepID=A0A2T3AIJ6_9PEZI|nr:hypothetical protein BD289DRAFT_458646 [Coniella lustricola]